ncbi:MAG: twin-arginine translocase TatA/TatE family subunit [Acidobacteria bacterium]|jgi:TatA/E family protein of Tat protein translocase|nr:twin-arginine translocase TatA/TatE family subunit [Acidobacteriota bacterium]
MGSVGTPEILLILLIALLVFGPQKLPELGKSLGRAVREFKKASSELQETLEREVDEIKRSGEASEPLPKGALPPPVKATERPDLGDGRGGALSRTAAAREEEALDAKRPETPGKEECKSTTDERR